MVQRTRVGGFCTEEVASMTATLTANQTAAEGYRHEALFWRGEDEFLCGTVPFIRDGLAAGEPVMVAVTLRHLQQLRTRLGSDVDRVRFVDMAELGQNPARIIPAWRSFVDEFGASGQRVRGVGEPIWAGRRPDEVSECQLHESLIDVALAPHAMLSLLCPYDADHLSPEVLAAAQLTHGAPVRLGPAGGGPFSGTESVVLEVFGEDLPEALGDAFVRSFTWDTLRSVHDDVLDRAVAAGISGERSCDLALAVHEVATNSVVHAGGEGVLRIWRRAGALVCEVRDRGRIADPLVGRHQPDVNGQHGRGLWMVNQLCDLVQIRSRDAGTTVRIHTWL